MAAGPRRTSDGDFSGGAGGAETGIMSGGPTEKAKRSPGWLMGAALLVATLLLFSRVLGPGYGFVNYDDPDYVTANPHVQAGFNAAGVKWALSAGIASNWHPLTWMSHMLDWSWFGHAPRGHHATSVVLHALNAALAFAALRRLTGALWTSAFCAALFAWHPLRVESVAWVSERKDVLSGFFFFAVLWAYAVYVERRRANDGRAWRFYGLALVALALGLMAKPMLVTLPCVLLLMDGWPLGRVRGLAFGRNPANANLPPEGGSTSTVAALIGEKLPFFALAAGSSVATYLVQKAGGSVTEALSLDARLGNAVVAVVRYVGKFLVPFDLAVLYPHPGHWPTRQVVAALVIVVVVSALAAWQFRRRPWIAVGWCWFLGTLVPVIGIVQVGLQSMADRYTYLTLLGVQIAGLWTLRAAVVSPGARRAWAIAGAGVLLACAARTWNQQGVWRNSFTLFDHALAVTSDNYLAYNNRGIHLGDAGRVAEAVEDYRRALAIRPDYPEANNNLGRILVQEGRPAEAVPLLRRSVAAKPTQLEARNNLANALSDTGALAEAMELYAFVLARDPRHVNALTNSAVALAVQGKLPEAQARLEQALQIKPDDVSAHSNLGNVFAMQGRRDDAIRHHRRAIALAPADARLHHNLANVLAEAGELAEAAASYVRAVAAAPTNAESRAHLGFTYARLGRREDALRELRAAVAQRPDYAQAKAWLQAVEQMR